jgi:hypothetical protein
MIIFPQKKYRQDLGDGTNSIRLEVNMMAWQRVLQQRVSRHAFSSFYVLVVSVVGSVSAALSVI